MNLNPIGRTEVVFTDGVLVTVDRYEGDDRYDVLAAARAAAEVRHGEPADFEERVVSRVVDLPLASRSQSDRARQAGLHNARLHRGGC